MLFDGLGKGSGKPVVLHQVEVVGERPVDRLAQAHEQPHGRRVLRDPFRRLGRGEVGVRELAHCQAVGAFELLPVPVRPAVEVCVEVVEALVRRQPDVWVH